MSSFVDEESNKLEQRHKIKIQQLEAKDAARRQKNEQRKTEVEARSDPTESASKFWFEFTEKRKEFDALLMKALTDQDKKVLEVGGEKLSQLKQFLSKAAFFLPAYDVRSCQEVLKKLDEILSERKLMLEPKKKFSFGVKRTEKKTTEALENAKVEKSNEISIPRARILSENSLRIANRKNEVIRFSSADLQDKDVSIETLENCKVYLPGFLAALFVHNVKGSELYIGVVAGATHIEGMVESCVMVATHQIRIHKTEETDFYLRVRSRPIVEHTKKVRFAPFQWCFAELDNFLQLADLSIENGKWAQVDDFRWLRSAQSPNWSELPTEERKPIFDIESLQS